MCAYLAHEDFVFQKLDAVPVPVATFGIQALKPVLVAGLPMQFSHELTLRVKQWVANMTRKSSTPGLG